MWECGSAVPRASSSFLRPVHCPGSTSKRPAASHQQVEWFTRPRQPPDAQISSFAATEGIVIKSLEQTGSLLNTSRKKMRKYPKVETLNGGGASRLDGVRLTREPNDDSKANTTAFFSWLGSDAIPRQTDEPRWQYGRGSEFLGTSQAEMTAAYLSTGTWQGVILST